MKLLLIYLILIPLSVHAISLTEIQEVRYAKAELAMIDGREVDAVRLLTMNLNSKTIHVPSFKLLARYHFDHRDYAKGFRVYYYLVRKFHGPYLLKTRVTKSFPRFLERVPVPNETAKELYFEIASLYLQAIEQDGLPQSKNQLTLLAFKYLSICQFYKIREADTQMALARINSQLENYDIAIDHILEAQELFEHDKNPDKNKSKELEFLLGETLLKSGFTDAGSLYLKSVYLDSKSSPVVKEFSSAYLQALKGTLISTSAFYNLKYSSNSHDLTEEELSNFTGSNNETFYKKKNGYVHSRGFNAFFLHTFESDLNFLLGGTFIDEKAADPLLNLKDSRTMALTTELKSSAEDKSQWKLRYNFNIFYLRPSTEDPIQQSSTLHIITPQYSHSLKSGIISYSLPYDLTVSSSSENTYALSFQIDYSPYRFSKYFMPSYSLRHTPRKTETSTLGHSELTSFSISNFSDLADRHALFTDLSIESKTNNEQSESYLEWYFGASYTYQFKFLPELSFNASFSNSQRKRRDSQIVKTLTMSSGLTYTF